jgi:acetylornithine deacetylase/succinyl-diaminopimelate desuccinylase-like protein
MDVVELASRLIEVPSPNLPGDERAVADVVQSAAESLGLGRGRVVGALPARPNVLIDIDFGPGGRTLALSGHIDTKPVGDARWSTDPFTPVIEDGYLYGLGSCDMKGAVAAMLIAAADVLRTPPPCGRLALVFTADEEHGSRFGSRYLAENRLIDADAIVIGEPGGVVSDWDAVHVVSRGIANVYIDVKGRQGHSSLSAVKGYTSATQQMARLMLAMANDFTPRYPANQWASTPTINAGVHVSGGVGFGVVPGLATFASDIRLVPGMERASFEEDLQAFLDAAAQGDSPIEASYRFEASPRDWLPPTAVDPASDIVQSCVSAMSAVLGVATPTGVFPGTTDACWLQGLLEIPTLPAFGPGMLARAHAADERVSIQALRDSVPIYSNLIRDFCGSTA